VRNALPLYVVEGGSPPRFMVPNSLSCLCFGIVAGFVLRYSIIIELAKARGGGRGFSVSLPRAYKTKKY